MLKLSLENSERPPSLRLANELHLYPSEVYASVKRARASHFVQGPELGDRLKRSSLLEILIHGVRHAFPVETGAPTRGVPTCYAASPLSKAIADAGDLPPVWPYADGKVRGYSFAPLHKNVPQAALEDERLYELLALVDALRNGLARERNLASQELMRRFEMAAESRFHQGRLISGFGAVRYDRER
jgi:hypothetical protein